MLIAKGGTFVVGGFLVSFIVAMIAIEEVAEFADLVLEMKSFYLGIVQLGIWSKSAEGHLQ